MSVYYYKGQPIVAPFKITSNHPSWNAESVSLRLHRLEQEAQRWELSFTVQASTGLANYLTDLVAGFGLPQTMIMPQLAEVEKRNTSSERNATGTAGGDSPISMTGSGLLPKGSFIQFANHPKIYITLADLNGPGSVAIYPRLRTNVSSTAVRHAKSTVKPMLSYFENIDNLRGISFSDGVLMDAGTIDLYEAV